MMDSGEVVRRVNECREGGKVHVASANYQALVREVLHAIAYNRIVKGDVRECCRVLVEL